MAITGSTVYKGLKIANAYVQVHHCIGGNKAPVNCVFRVYFDLAARQASEDNFLYESYMKAPTAYIPGHDPVDTCYATMQAADGDFPGFTNC